MRSEICNLVAQYEAGRLTRRELVSRLATLMAILAGSPTIRSAPETSMFEALGLNHIALRVSDVERSRDFYQKVLGLKVVRHEPGQTCFLTFGDAFLALFRNQQPAMDHYCYSVKDYHQGAAAEKLRSAGIAPELQASNRIYFKDPDGLKVQLAALDHRPA